MFFFYVKHVAFSNYLFYQRSERGIVEPEKAKKHFDGAGKLPRLALGNSLLGSAHPWFYQRLSGVASPSTLLAMPFFTSKWCCRQSIWRWPPAPSRSSTTPASRATWSGCGSLSSTWLVWAPRFSKKVPIEFQCLIECNTRGKTILTEPSGYL